ncbi:helix-turn-helix transcriptional regulator [Thalassobius sp. S69A]|uniref:helix-turn-helix transcriptional regulator n=1 Tax=unclassified Thalassovita TaxID=2619711 RepID=UPI003C7ADDD5
MTLSQKKAILMAIMAVQVFCTFFFVAGVLKHQLGIEDFLPFRHRETAEIGAAIGLTLGGAMGWVALRRALLRSHRAEAKLRLASGAFMELLDERFSDWRLTPAERDVALFALKGLSTHEIADMRNTSEGTVKAQSNAIYRKAGVGSRSQLLSLFIEDLMLGDIPPAAASTA